MKLSHFLFCALCFISLNLFSQVEYKIVTSVESIVPLGVGRSRLITTDTQKSFADYTSSRSGDKEKDKRNKSNRSDIRVKDFEETKLLNFYNLTGIRFQNIVANDVLVTSKLNELAQEGWELVFVTGGVESDAGKDDGNGIFITRYIFKRQVSTTE
ncbi:hypothetical protein [Winogradskyella aurantiaca]|uniref:hypothetical protein n=1 Tax=Winogradskyella aurantiaca TaxID=2219558 RepID=UPI0013005EE5|nr:hypothetical protein [Winogradskyella aurantiaca]